MESLGRSWELKSARERKFDVSEIGKKSLWKLFFEAKKKKAEGMKDLLSDIEEEKESSLSFRLGKYLLFKKWNFFFLVEIKVLSRILKGFLKTSAMWAKFIENTG